MLKRYAKGWVVLLFLLGWAVLPAHEPVSKSPPAPVPPKATLKTLTVYPTKISLDGPRAEQRVGVLGDYADGRAWDLGRSVKFSIAKPDIATVDATGLVRPMGDGETILTIQAGGKRTTIPIKVTKATADIPVSFSREIVPILTKAGCNQGACHGAQHGRGGFKLSLLGFDPAFDYPQIVQSAEGRRVVLSDP